VDLALPLIDAASMHVCFICIVANSSMESHKTTSKFKQLSNDYHGEKVLACAMHKKKTKNVEG
jgi:hypothetical protein